MKNILFVCNANQLRSPTAEKIYSEREDLNVKSVINLDIEDEYEQLRNWQGLEAREMTPLGYCGNPSNYDIKAVEEIDAFFFKNISSSIIDKLKCL